MKKLIYTKGTEFEQNGYDLAIIDTNFREGKPIMLKSKDLDLAILNGDQAALDRIEIEDTKTPTVDVGINYTEYHENNAPKTAEVVGYESLPTLSITGTLGETITKLVIDPSIKEVEKDMTFSGTNIEEIDLGGEKTFMKSTHTTYGTSSYGIFSGCPNLKRIIGKVKLGRSYSNVFSGCKKLTDVDFSSGGYIYGYMFNNCESLNWTELPSHIRYIGYYDPNGSSMDDHCFYNCKELALTEIPENVSYVLTSTSSSIGNYNFANCTKLALKKLPKSWVTLSDYMFQNCPSLQITDLTQCKWMGAYCFNNCTGLKELKLGLQTGYREYRNIFAGCTGLEKVTFDPEISNVTNTGEYNFQNCTNLREISLPPTVTAISSYSFDGCSSLKTINNADNVVTLSSYCFQNTGLEIVPFTKNVTSINTYAFKGCTKLKDIDLSSITTLTNSGIFSGCSSLKKLVLPNIQKFGTTSSTSSNAILYQGALKAIWMGSSLTTLNNYSFLGVTGTLKKVYIDLPRATVTAWSSYKYCFSGTTSLDPASVIVCNDDADFLTQEEFEAIDWDTYGEEE